MYIYITQIVADWESPYVLGYFSTEELALECRLAKIKKFKEGRKRSIELFKEENDMVMAKLAASITETVIVTRVILDEELRQQDTVIIEE